MRLLVDIGNTRLKWALAESDTDDFVQTGAIPVTDLVQLERLWGKIIREPLSVVTAVSVGDEAVNRWLGNWVAKKGGELQWLDVSKRWGNLKNAYAIDELGADRWLAAIAAWTQWGDEGRAIGVVDAGSATTVDAISANGVFLGGFILPGQRLMARALNTDTAQIVTGGERTEKRRGFPQNTRAAVSAGVELASLGGMVQAMREVEQMLGMTPRWLFTGGDGKALCAAVKRQEGMAAKYQANLVLQGVLVASAR